VLRASYIALRTHLYNQQMDHLVHGLSIHQHPCSFNKDVHAGIVLSNYESHTVNGRTRPFIESKFECEVDKLIAHSLTTIPLSNSLQISTNFGGVIVSEKT
jgi:hypothetical protein